MASNPKHPSGRPRAARAPLRARLAGAFLLLAAAPALLPAQEPAAPAPELARRLQILQERLEAERIRQHIPGMGFALVRGDEVLLARGFGLAEVECGTPATEATRFEIGSSTKAFTTTLVAMLEAEGVLSWDDPVTKYLPFYDLQVDAPGDPEVLLRDLACHRTGYPRQGLLWVAGALQPDEILRTASGGRPYASFRERFLYNNVQFLALGRAAAAASGRSWDALIQERLLDPLGMEATSPRRPEDLPRARGYVWNGDLARVLPEEEMKVGPVAPAGAIVSTAADMTRWLRFQIGRGAFAGRRLLPEEALTATWETQIGIGPGVSYGLGWMRHEGERLLIEHGGNTFGYSAMVAFLPEEELGFVLLTNLSAAPLQNQSLSLVFDTLLGPLPGDGPAAGEGGDPAPFLGEFVADFPPFDGEIFTVRAEDGVLILDIPSQTAYRLGPPDEEGLRPFEIAPQIRTGFEDLEDGRYQVLRLYQGQLVFEIPRKGHVVRGSLSEEEARPYLGRYRSANPAIGVFSVEFRDGRLWVDIPKQMAFPLEPPGEDGRWVYHTLPAASIEFHEEDGRVVAATLRQDLGGSDYVERVPRLGGEEDGELPPLSALVALHAGAGRAPAGLVRARGRIEAVHCGVEGRFTWWDGGPERLRSEQDFGRLGRSVTVVVGEAGRTRGDLGPDRILTRKEAAAALFDHPRLLYGDWPSLFPRSRVLRADERDGRACWLVELRSGNLPPARAWVDAETGDFLRIESRQPAGEMGYLEVQTELHDWRDFGGLRLPARVVTENPQTGRTVLHLEEVEILEKTPEGLFELD